MSDTNREQRLEAVIAVYLEARHAGQAPPRDRWLGEHPDLADDLRRFLDNQEWLLRLGQQPADRDADESPATLDWASSGRVADLGTVNYFGDYELLSELARGSMGIVYRARQVSLNRIVALKMILAGEQASDDEMRRFRLETEAAANLDHPGIVPIYEVGEHGARHYYSMKLIEGSNLGKLVPDLLSDPRRAARLMASVARAVHYAHQHGILHRDLKPANILIDTNGEPHVTDFGLALRVEGDRISLSGAIVGTPNYMPPEQALADKNLTTAGDVWSLGAILYECLTGRPPFGGANVYEILQQVVEREPDRPSAINRRADADLAVIAMKCLHKEPAGRYESAAALADDLDRWGRGEPIHARAVGPMERAWRMVRRNPAIAALTAAVLFMLLAGTVVSTLLAIRAGEKADEAVENERIAREEEKRADGNARKAVEEGEVARAEKKRADAQLDRAEMLVYAGKLALAQSEWKANEGASAIEVLGECQWNLRGWEHRYLWTLFTSHNQRMARGRIKHKRGRVEWSPDGKRIASGRDDKTVEIWDAETGRDILTIQGIGWREGKFAWSHDGGRIAGVSDNSTVKVWDSKTGRELVVLKAEAGDKKSLRFFWAVAWRPDGGRIAGACYDRTVRIWDAKKGGELSVLEGHEGPVYAVTWSPDGKRVASGDSDGTVRVWDTEKNRECLVIKTGGGDVNGIAWSPDGRRIASCGNNGMLMVWDAEKGDEIFKLDGRGLVWCVKWSPDGKRIASSGVNETVQIWDAEKGREVLSLKGYRHGVTSVGWSPDGKHIVSSDEETVKIWDAEKGQDLLALKGHRDDVNSVVWSPDSRRIATGGSAGELKVWNLQKRGNPLTLTVHQGGVSSVAWSPDGKSIVSPSWDKTVKIWDADSGRECRAFTGHDAEVYGVAWSHDGRRIASVGDESTVRVWDAQKCEGILTLEGGDKRVYSVVWSPDDRYLASVSDDGRARVWELDTGRQLFALEISDPQYCPLGVAWSPDGKRIAGSTGRGVKVWDAKQGQELLTLEGREVVNSVAWSPDGKRIAGSTGRGIRIWDAEKGREVLLVSLKGDRHGVSSVAWSPDGKRIAGADGDTVKIYDGSLTAPVP
jgi:WD40 repeat protein